MQKLNDLSRSLTRLEVGHPLITYENPQPSEEGRAAVCAMRLRRPWRVARRSP
jgi:hypothetical protein